MTKISHTYTAQYSLSMAGKLLPHVFLCFQEPAGKFGPIVQKRVDELTKDYRNIVVVCSKSGKLTSELFTSFLKSTILPYVQNNDFLLLVDSWHGQTNIEIYDDIFTNKEGNSTCTLKIIPPKCTPLVQPCDVYFYRQVKIFIKKIQNCAYLLEHKREISSREDGVRFHSLIHHQLTSPIFQSMLQYAWFASGFINERTVFLNVNQVCFSVESLSKSKCQCGQLPFIQCSFCRKCICFPCFYDNYHPKICKIG